MIAITRDGRRGVRSVEMRQSEVGIRGDGSIEMLPRYLRRMLDVEVVHTSQKFCASGSGLGTERNCHWCLVTGRSHGADASRGACSYRDHDG
jgi:hypothetical protein